MVDWLIVDYMLIVLQNLGICWALAAIEQETRRDLYGALSAMTCDLGLQEPLPLMISDYNYICTYHLNVDDELG